jgi:uncharacterized protein
MAEPLGLITRGSLSQGLQLKLEPGCSIEDMRVGRFVVIEGRENRFFCLVTDMELGATNPRVLLDPPVGNRLAGVVLDGITTFGQVAVTPMLMLPRDDRRPAPCPEGTRAASAARSGATGRPQAAVARSGTAGGLQDPVVCRRTGAPLPPVSCRLPPRYGRHAAA